MISASVPLPVLFVPEMTADRHTREPPRVVMLLDAHYPPDRRIELESSLLRQAGAAVRIVAWDRRPAAERTDAGARPQGEQVLNIPFEAPRVGGLASIARAGRFSLHVLRHSRALVGRPTVLVVHDLYLLPLAWLLSVLWRLTLVYDAHEEFAAMEANRYPEWVLRVVTTAETLLARRAKVVVVPGETRVPRWKAAGRDPIVLPNHGLTDGPPPTATPEWDVAYCGTIAEHRRVDLLVEVARRNPELRVAVAGQGRTAAEIQKAAEDLPNLDFLGFVDDADGVLARARSVYYGFDPNHPYAPKACPNTLYQALRVKRPLIYFGGGEIERLAGLFNIGIRADLSADGVTEAIHEAAARDDWQFEPAWRNEMSADRPKTYVERVLA